MQNACNSTRSALGEHGSCTLGARWAQEGLLRVVTFRCLLAKGGGREVLYAQRKEWARYINMNSITLFGISALCLDLRMKVWKVRYEMRGSQGLTAKDSGFQCEDFGN